MDNAIVAPAAEISILQQVDPAVSIKKFERELNTFKQVEEYNRQRGVILVDVEFPAIRLAFYAYRIRPLVLAFAIKLTFINYDLEPPSLKFIDLLTYEELIRPALPIQLLRQQRNPVADQQPGMVNIIPPLDLIQAHSPRLIPFICLPGLREYHEHPAHSNDPWLAHRGKGEGSLGFIIDQLHKYGTEPINGILPLMTNIQQLNPAGMLVQSQGLTFTRDEIPL